MKRLWFGIIIAGLMASGCSYYSFSGSLPSHIKTAAVPLFENRTVEPGLVEDLTDIIESAILSDGNMKITGEAQADALVQGTIVEFIDEADSFSRDEQAKQFKVYIYAEVRFLDVAKNEPLWEESRMEGWGLYDAPGAAGGEGNSREDAIEEALSKLAKDIIDNTVAGW